MLSAQSAGKRSIILRYRDSASGVSSKAKPPGVTACQIFAAAAPTPITDPTLLPLKVLATKSPVVVHFDASEANLPAYFAARWGVQARGVSWLVADRELYGSDRRMTRALLSEKGARQLPHDSLRAGTGGHFPLCREKLQVRACP